MEAAVGVGVQGWLLTTTRCWPIRLNDPRREEEGRC